MYRVCGVALGLMLTASVGIVSAAESLDDCGAVDDGKVITQFRLGLKYEKGRGAPQHYGCAVYWYNKAAKQGSIAAQTKLGAMYAEGRGVEADPLRAHVWFNIAASKLMAAPGAEATQRRDIITRKLGARVEQAQKMARDLCSSRQQRAC